MTLALIAPGVTLGLGELDAVDGCGAAVDVLRADASVGTFLAIHRALRQRKVLSPVPAAATDQEVEARRIAVAGLTTRADAFALIATSGTSGRPRLVELSHGAAAAHAASSNAHLVLDVDDRWLVALPLWHVGGLATIVRCRAARATVVFDPPPPLGPTWVDWLRACVTRHRITRLSLVPAQLDCLARDPRAAPPWVRTVLIGGQALPPAMAARAIAHGWPIVASYGLTESFGMCIATPPGTEVDDSVGHPLPGVRVRVVRGCLEIATPSLASAIHGDRTVPVGEWLRTADRARADGDRVTILGRADDVVVTGGHKVDPLEVEAALTALDWVRDAVVFGVADDRFGEVVAAAIVLEDTWATGGIEARTWAALQHLPRHKRPRRVCAVARLPRLPNHKVDRIAARALVSKSPRS